MNELHRLSALRALPAIDIHAHYGCWNLPWPQLQSAQAEMPGELSLLLRKKESAGLPVRLGGLAAASAVKFLTLYLLVVQLLCRVLTLAEKQVQTFTAMFSWPQLITALIGGALALAVVPLPKKAQK